MDNLTSKGKRKSPNLNEFNELEQSTSENEEEDSSEDQEEIYGWDLFRSFPTKPKTGSYTDKTFYERLLQFTKMVTYLILFVVVLGGSVLSKSSILLMTSQINPKNSVAYCEYNQQEEQGGTRKLVTNVPEEDRLVWYWCIFIAFCIPELISLINSIHYVLFKKKKYPSVIDAILVCFIDGIHVIGLTILLFIIIPEFDSIQAVTIISTIFFIPVLLDLLMQRRLNESTIKFIIKITGNILALIIQITIFLIFSLHSSDIDIQVQWLLPTLSIALIFTSCRWWSNFVSGESQLKFAQFLWHAKERMELSRGIMRGITALWRISVFFLLSIAIIYWKGIPIDEYFQSIPGIVNYNVTLNEVTDNRTLILKDKSAGSLTVNSETPLVILAVNVIASFFTYTACKFSSQTLMQQFGFSLPSILAVPMTVIFIFVLSLIRSRDVCALHQFFPDYLFFYSPKNLNDTWTEWQYWIWILQLVTQIWTTIHIWMPHNERLATADRIFTVPSYDSLIIDQSLTLNRRKDQNLNDVLNIPDFDSENVKKHTERSSENSLNAVKARDRITKIYACATMWHELEGEMELCINSILRLDLYQAAMTFIQKRYNIQVDDYFELETHIFFDDAFQCMHNCEGSCTHDENETHVNDYVKTLIDIMKSSVEHMGMLATPPMKYPAPYGGRLEWILPGKTRLLVHLKDKNKIRHRKRWSQVMYMYYLLGYRLIDQPIHINRKVTIAENTYILTLDGDIDFRPTAVKVLLHLMKRNKELGAACGRIHPIGNGPMVWFQKFEYAIGHWLQKSTEHTIGSVLCSPGCFSLFRAKALMEDNVMHKYATRSTDARHYIQFDQGEDRWLCTLILQSGYRVEYSAASDSYTHVPETFNEFFNQRRRWIPSTIANIFDLLNSSKETRKTNENISWLYLVYHWALMGSTILGPGTIFLMLIGALVAALGIDNRTSLYFNLIPLIIFVVACLTCKPKVQLIIAAMVSAFYGLIMVVVLVGIMIQITEDGWVAPSTILFLVVTLQLIFAALVHPQEWSCLICGLIYYVTVPSMYMLLIIYSIFNVHDVTWGTRESKIPLTQKIGFEIPEDQQIPGENKINIKNAKGSIDFSLAGLFRCMFCTQNQQSEEMNQLGVISQSLNEISTRLEVLEKTTVECETQTKATDIDEELGKTSNESSIESRSSRMIENGDDSYPNSSNRSFPQRLNNSKSTNFLVNPRWIQDPDVRKGGVEFLCHEEEIFWNRLIRKYLYPLDMDKKKIEKMENALKRLRNDNIFKFFMLNALFVLTILLMQFNKAALHFEWPLGATYNITVRMDRKEVHIERDYLKLEPIGCVFIAGFLVILLIQFFAMILHRYNTFLHLLSNTLLKFNSWRKPKDISEEDLLETHVKDIIDGLQRLAEENGIPDWKHERQSTFVSPEKRHTVHALVEYHDKRTRAPSDFHTIFRQNLTRTTDNTRFTTGIAHNVLQALNRRRTTLVAQQRAAQQQRNESTLMHENGNNNQINSDRQSNEDTSHAYNNQAFVDDDINNIDNENASYTQNHVKFCNINENS